MADAVVVAHLLFILFVLFGGVLVARWPRLAWVHLPCAVWGVLVEAFGWICPLTPLENALRSAAGLEGYPGGFVEQYLIPVVYPRALTRPIQIAAGALVLGVNAALYARTWRRRRPGTAAPPSPRS